jgi:hypothetical protein
MEQTPIQNPSMRLAFTPLERLSPPRPVDRISFIAANCTGRRVLDLGAMDETAFAAKRGLGTWLHEEIGKVAASVEGIDSSDLVPPEGLRTGPRSIIRHVDSSATNQFLAALDPSPEVVVAGELIEHLENPLGFLASLRENPRLRGVTLILSTPNATALHNCLIALGSRESTHPDHLCIFSYKTLTTLCRRAGFEDWSIIPYFARFTEMEQRNRGVRRLMVRGGQRIINGLEWLFPLMSFGYIVLIRI